MSKFHLNLRSDNAKTGPIPVSTSSMNTCPRSCGMFDTCYAKFGPISMHWKRVDDRGMEWPEFIDKIMALPRGTFWRHNQAGDLPCDSRSVTIDPWAMQQLIAANDGKRGFTYTHHRIDLEWNRSIIENANASGFTVNVSCDTLAEVDAATKIIKAPLVVVLPSDTTAKSLRTPEGRKVVVCYAPKNGVTCDKCRICQSARPDRAVIGFPAHGTRKKVIDIQLRKEQ